jgi:hypothetical protein
VGRGLNLKRGPDDGKLERLCCSGCRKLLPRRRGSGAAACGRNAYTGEKCVVLVAVLGSRLGGLCGNLAIGVAGYLPTGFGPSRSRKAAATSGGFAAPVGLGRSIS